MNRLVYRMEKAGSIDDLQLVEDQLPDPADNEATIEVKAIGLNFADIAAIQSLYKAAPKERFIPGLEYSGVVVKTGKGAGKFKVGDKVIGVTRFGGYVSHLNIDERYIFPLKETWSFSEGAGYLVQVLTAYYGLVHLGALEQGSTVLINSAAGGVGTWANRIAKQYKAYTIGTVGSDKKIDYCKQEGYDRVFVRSENFEQSLVEALDGRPLNLVMDSIGGKLFKIAYRLMAPQGRLVIYGSARYMAPGSKPNFLKLLYTYLRRPKLDPQSMINYNKAVLGFNLIYLYENVQLMNKILSELNELDIGTPVVGHTFPFEKLKEAIYLYQTGKTTGKVVAVRD